MYLNNFNPRTRLDPTVISVLEHHFQNQKNPCVEEMTFLAQSLQLENKVVSNWFKNRKQKERRKMLYSHKTTIPEVPSGKMVENILRSSEMLSRQFKRIIRNPNLMDVYNSPLNLSNRAISRNVKRFSLGKPNGMTQRRTILVLGTGGQIHQRFINQIINYIVNVKEADNFRFLVEEETGHSNCIYVYDIHHTFGFRIPFSLTIVVTPHSGDSEDSGQLFRDRKVAEMFLDFIEAKDGIKELDMICNVTVETGGRKQQFLSIFGKDVEKNINNWKLSVDFLSDKGPWQAVVHHFFIVLATMKTAPLLLTKMVLHERKKMEEVVDRLQPLVAAGSSKMEKMNKTKLTIAYCDYQLKIIEQEMYLNYTSSTASASCTCSELHCRMGPVDNHSVFNFSGEGPWFDNPNHGDPQSCYFDEAKWNDMKAKGQQLVKILQKDLLKNGNSIRHHLNYIWRCIHRFNKFALHGNSFSNQKVFDLLLEAGQHLKELNF
ncbi:uncharacterized protein LOC124198733 [Daphnia pulex]|uniref:uncharacterized protein LOC124198733 n=1 Tax=Daphnia pulex TaxID=6669 RepID=UPI001EDDD0AA|nr:uncharacterized protein LOC124198733 [Daphnia pulex]